MKTAIRNGAILAWKNERHTLLEAGTIVVEDSVITSVGPDYEGSIDQTIDATGRLLIPGLVNSHLHVTDTPYTKGYLEESGDTSGGNVSQSFHSLYSVLPAVRHATDPEAQVIAAESAFAELARTGSTTVVEMGYDFEIGGGGDIAITEQVAEVAGRSGLRCYSAPRYRSRSYGDDGAGQVAYSEYGAKALERFDACLEFCQGWNGRYDDRLRTMLAPGQINTCSEQLLKDTRRYANELGLPIQLHAGQSPNEYSRVRETEGKSMIEFLMDTGLLGPDFIIGHGQILTDDGDVSSMPAHEVEALRDSGTSICHLPWVKARRGGVINSIQKYHDLGFRQCLGTDTYPFDMFNEMRTASVVCKIVEQSAEAARCEEIFHMATAGGADALNRTDLGRIATGCKADLVFIRTDTPKASPLYDPFKFLVHAASDADVDKVMVNGKVIVDNGQVLTLDVDDVVRRINEASKRVWGRMS